MKQEGRKKLFPPPRRDAGVAFIFESALGGSRSSKRRTKSRRPDEPDGPGRKAEHGVAHKVWALAVATPRDVQHGYIHIAVVIYTVDGDLRESNNDLCDSGRSWYSGYSGLRSCNFREPRDRVRVGQIPYPCYCWCFCARAEGRKWHAEQPNRPTGWTVQANCAHYYGVKQPVAATESDGSVRQVQ